MKARAPQFNGDLRELPQGGAIALSGAPGTGGPGTKSRLLCAPRAITRRLKMATKTRQAPAAGPSAPSATRAHRRRPNFEGLSFGANGNRSTHTDTNVRT
jgi:hypothetical protein